MTDLRKAAEQAIEAIMNGGAKEQAAAVYELRQALAQPKREWVGLTDEELEPLCDLWKVSYGSVYVDEFARAIETKLKEKGEEHMKNREWQELNVNEVIQLISENITDPSPELLQELYSLMSDVDMYLQEKNSGS